MEYFFETLRQPLRVGNPAEAQRVGMLFGLKREVLLILVLFAVIFYFPMALSD
jgi:hypothetical protein